MFRLLVALAFFGGDLDLSDFIVSSRGWCVDIGDVTVSNIMRKIIWFVGRGIPFSEVGSFSAKSVTIEALFSASVETRDDDGWNEFLKCLEGRRRNYVHSQYTISLSMILAEKKRSQHDFRDWKYFFFTLE